MAHYVVGRSVLSSPCRRLVLSPARVHSCARSAGKRQPISRVNNAFSTGARHAGHHHEGGGASRGRGGVLKVSGCSARVFIAGVVLWVLI